MMITAHNQNFVMDSRGWERETERVCVRERERNMMITAHNQNFVMDSRGWEGETERVCVREREGKCL